MSTTEMRVNAGEHIREALADAVAMANELGHRVTFDFNGTKHDARPGDTYETAKGRAEERTGSPIRTREEEMEHFRKEHEWREAETARAFAESGAATEGEMREAKVPTPKTPEELAEYVAGLTDRPHDYGTCVYAMSMAATAAFNYVAHKLGVTGFQASCADMDILRRTRGIEDGFRLVNYGDLLYPQYWDAERAPIFEVVLQDPDTRTRFAEKARRLLRQSGSAAPAVVDHWERIASLPSPESPESPTLEER